MTVIHHISGHLKGRQFSETLEAVTCFCGGNGAGKSTRLLAVELALHGPRSKDRRFGPGTAQVTAECAAGVIRRELSPKHKATLNGKGDRVAEVQAEINRQVPVSAQVFDIAAFVGMSEEKKRQALLDLAAPIPAAEVATIYPELVPVDGERASDWLLRAMEAAKQERLALQAKVRESTKTTVALDNATRGRFESLDVARGELDLAQQAERSARQCVANFQRVSSLEEQLSGVQAQLAGVESVAAAGVLQDVGSYEKGLRDATERERRMQAAVQAHTAAKQEVDRQTRAIDGMLQTNAGVLVRLTLAHAAVVQGDLDAVSQALQALDQGLQAQGFVALTPARERLEKAMRSQVQAGGDETRTSNECSKERTVSDWQSDLAKARLHNAGVEQAKAQAQAAERQRFQLQERQTELQRQLDELTVKLPAGEFTCDLEGLASTVRELQAEVEQMAQRQGVRQAEVRLAEQALQAQERVAVLKRIEESLSEARDDVLRRAMAPVESAMGPFVRLMGGRFEVGEEAVLGIRRAGTWLPVECLSDSEQALFGAGLALALAGAGGGSMVLVDRLDVCDADRSSAFLAEAVAAVQRGEVDQVLATAHTLGTSVPGVCYRMVESGKI